LKGQLQSCRKVRRINEGFTGRRNSIENAVLKGHDFSRADKASRIKVGFSRRGMLSMKPIVIKRFSAASLALRKVLPAIHPFITVSPQPH
jgi:hypothetical protein